jgi:hypothetical protein
VVFEDVWPRIGERGEILKDNARPEAGDVYTAMDMGWATLVGQVAHAYGK